MRSLSHSGPLLLLFWMACQPASQKEIPQLLPGEWSVYNFELKGEIDPKIEAYAKHLAQTVRYEFKPDFQYTIWSDEDPEGRSGSWSWFKEKQLLELRIPDEEPSEVRVLRMDDEVAVFESQTAEMGTVKVYLRRNKAS